MFRSKSKKVKNGLKLNVISPFSYSFWLKMVFFKITSLSIELRLKLKCSADQILTINSDFVSFDHFRVGLFQTTDMFANLLIKKI